MKKVRKPLTLQQLLIIELSNTDWKRAKVQKRELKPVFKTNSKF